MWLLTLQIFLNIHSRPQWAWVLLNELSLSFLKCITWNRVKLEYFLPLKFYSSQAKVCLNRNSVSFCILLNCSVFVMAEFNWSKLKLWPSISYRLNKRIDLYSRKKNKQLKKNLKNKYFSSFIRSGNKFK